MVALFLVWLEIQTGLMKLKVPGPLVQLVICIIGSKVTIYLHPKLWEQQNMRKSPVHMGLKAVYQSSTSLLLNLSCKILAK